MINPWALYSGVFIFVVGILVGLLAARWLLGRSPSPNGQDNLDKTSDSTPPSHNIEETELYQHRYAQALERSVAPKDKLRQATSRELAKVFKISNMRTRLLAETKAAAITELVELLDETGEISDCHAAMEAIIAREEKMSTGLEKGIAIPHARTDSVQQLTAAVGIKREGIDFGSPDGEPARIIVLLLAPLNAPTPLLQTLAHLIHILNEQGHAAALECDSPEELHKLLVQDQDNRSSID